MRRIWMQSDGERLAPYVAGTDIHVAAVLALIEQGCSSGQICRAHYPGLTPADVRACLQYAQRRPSDATEAVPEDLVRPAPYPRAFWLDCVVPFLLAAIVTALFWIYYRAPQSESEPYPMSLLQGGASADSAAKKAEALKLAGDVAYASQRLPEAESWYRRALAINPRNAAAALDLGLVYFRQRRLPDAEKQYMAAAALDPRDAVSHFDLGLLYSSQGNFADARLQFILATALNPNDPDYRYSLGKSCCDLHRYDEAIPQFELALQIDPAHRLAAQSLRYAHRMYASRPDPATADR
ncbi:MAG TPA: tetratricopeptide repeat protein [Chthonomonadaceae bacterium]|nr:tetratricopeptide repeat protein [Chthonomonadaceae bacterium]